MPPNIVKCFPKSTKYERKDIQCHRIALSCHRKALGIISHEIRVKPPRLSQVLTRTQQVWKKAYIYKATYKHLSAKDARICKEAEKHLAATGKNLAYRCEASHHSKCFPNRTKSVRKHMQRPHTSTFAATEIYLEVYYMESGFGHTKVPCPWNESINTRLRENMP